MTTCQSVIRDFRAVGGFQFCRNCGRFLAAYDGVFCSQSCKRTFDRAD